MIEKLKHIHHMFYVGLIFMAFPFCYYFLWANSLLAFLFSSLFYGELSGNPHYGK